MLGLSLLLLGLLLLLGRWRGDGGHLLLALGEKALPLVEGRFAFMQLAQLVGLLFLEAFLGLLIGVGRAGAGAAAAGEEDGAGEDEDDGEELHTHCVDAGRRSLIQNQYSTQPGTMANFDGSGGFIFKCMFKGNTD